MIDKEYNHYSTENKGCLHACAAVDIQIYTDRPQQTEGGEGVQELHAISL